MVLGGMEGVGGCECMWRYTIGERGVHGGVKGGESM